MFGRRKKQRLSVEDMRTFASGKEIVVSPEQIIDGLSYLPSKHPTVVWKDENGGHHFRSLRRVPGGKELGRELIGEELPDVTNTVAEILAQVKKEL